MTRYVRPKPFAITVSPNLQWHASGQHPSLFIALFPNNLIRGFANAVYRTFLSWKTCCNDTPLHGRHNAFKNPQKGAAVFTSKYKIMVFWNFFKQLSWRSLQSEWRIFFSTLPVTKFLHTTNHYKFGKSIAQYSIIFSAHFFWKKSCYIPHAHTHFLLHYFFHFRALCVREVFFVVVVWYKITMLVT